MAMGWILILVFAFIIVAFAFFRKKLGKYRGMEGIDKSELKEDATLFDAFKSESQRIVNEVKGEKIEENMFKSASFVGASLRMRLSNLQSSLDYLQKNAAANPLKAKAVAVSLDPYIDNGIDLAEKLKKREEAEEKLEKNELNAAKNVEKGINKEKKTTHKMKKQTASEEKDDKKSVQTLAGEKQQEQEEIQLEHLEEIENGTNKTVKAQEKNKKDATKKDEKSLDNVISLLKSTKKFLSQEKWAKAYSNCSEAIRILDETRGDELKKLRLTNAEESEESQEFSIDQFKSRLARDIALKITARLQQRKKKNK